jgi:hypothetical protein
VSPKLYWLPNVAVSDPVWVDLVCGVVGIALICELDLLFPPAMRALLYKLHVKCQSFLSLVEFLELLGQVKFMSFLRLWLKGSIEARVVRADFLFSRPWLEQMFPYCYIIVTNR